MGLFDLIIIGAGPAGLSAAIEGAVTGLKVLVLEEHKTVGLPMHCGEAISSIGLKALNRKVPSELIVKNIEGIRCTFPNGKKVVFFEKGVVLNKANFEQWLAREAISNGAQVLLSEKVTGLEFQRSTWQVQTKKGLFEGKVLIDASGVSSVTSELLKFNSNPEKILGVQYLVDKIKSGDFLDFYFLPNLAPSGYLWIIPKDGERANVGIATSNFKEARKRLDKFLQRKGFDKGMVLKVSGGLINCSGPFKNICADGLMLVGDAAGFTSPLFKGGTFAGIQSGVFAVKVAVRAVNKGDWSKGILQEYQMLCKNNFPPNEKAVKGRKIFYSLSKQELKSFSEIFPKKIRELTSFQKLFIVIKVIRRPLLKEKGIRRVLEAFLYSRAKYFGW